MTQGLFLLSLLPAAYSAACDAGQFQFIDNAMASPCSFHDAVHFRYANAILSMKGGTTYNLRLQHCNHMTALFRSRKNGTLLLNTPRRDRCRQPRY